MQLEEIAKCQKEPSRVPLATYRLQFNRQFTFRDGRETVSYLAELGISDAYASPLFEAAPDSTHGYDVCGFGAFNRNLGTRADFERFCTALQERQMGMLLDLVPNHMGASLANGWWADVLEKGISSRYSTWFDINWHPCNPELRDKVLLPVLEDHYGKVLENGKLKLGFEKGGFVISYYDKHFPLAPQSYPAVLEFIRARLGAESAGAVNTNELEYLVNLSHALGEDPFSAELFQELRMKMAALFESSSQVRGHLDAALEAVNGRPGEPGSFDFLDGLLRSQHYRLAWWRVGPEEINYRRFFDITTLVCLRMEQEETFQAAHAFTAELIRQKKITGVRIDHPDGLWDPKQYCERLQRLAGGCFYIVVEKILTGEEPLPMDWPVAGTTGYDFLNRLNALFIQQSNEAEFDVLYREFAGQSDPFPAFVHAGKLEILRRSLISELDALTSGLKQIAAGARHGRDLSWRQLRAALEEIIAGFLVYRTYANAKSSGPLASEREKGYVVEAVRSARAFNPNLDPVALDFIEELLLLRIPEGLDEADQALCREWVMKLQQLTGPVMAKGLEDTAFYRFNRFVSLNEVGGDPAVFGRTVTDFHRYNTAKAAEWPHALLATATHDTKRGEDVRARLNVLSEMPAEWKTAVVRWSELNRDQKTSVQGLPAPDTNTEYLFYQTLVGAWTSEATRADGLNSLRQRMEDYMLKAVREAKSHTTWIEPNSAYENALSHFIKGVLAERRPASNPFLDEFKPFQQKVAFFGTFNSLSQVLLKLTCPGVPDLYQGTELWDFSLVDPDNRRPVDFTLRQKMLADLKRSCGGDIPREEVISELLSQSESGAIKLYLVWRVFGVRAALREVFQCGDYSPLETAGERAAHVCAFKRSSGPAHAVIVAPRLFYTLTAGSQRVPVGKETWGNTTVSLRHKGSQRYLNTFTGRVLESGNGKVRLADALESFPVALLQSLA